MISEKLVFSTIDELEMIYNHAIRIFGEDTFKEKIKDYPEYVAKTFELFDNDPLEFLQLEHVQKVLNEIESAEKLVFLALVYEITIKSKTNGNS